jgi:hypothetical protein
VTQTYLPKRWLSGVNVTFGLTARTGLASGRLMNDDVSAAEKARCYSPPPLRAEISRISQQMLTPMKSNSLLIAFTGGVNSQQAISVKTREFPGSAREQ